MKPEFFEITPEVLRPTGKAVTLLAIAPAVDFAILGFCNLGSGYNFKTDAATDDIRLLGISHHTDLTVAHLGIDPEKLGTRECRWRHRDLSGLSSDKVYYLAPLNRRADKQYLYTCLTRMKAKLVNE